MILKTIIQPNSDEENRVFTLVFTGMYYEANCFKTAIEDKEHSRKFIGYSLFQIVSVQHCSVFDYTEAIPGFTVTIRLKKPCVRLISIRRYLSRGIIWTED